MCFYFKGNPRQRPKEEKEEKINKERTGSYQSYWTSYWSWWTYLLPVWTSILRRNDRMWQWCLCHWVVSLQLCRTCKQAKGKMVLSKLQRRKQQSYEKIWQVMNFISCNILLFYYSLILQNMKRQKYMNTFVIMITKNTCTILNWKYIVFFFQLVYYLSPEFFLFKTSNNYIVPVYEEYWIVSMFRIEYDDIITMT